MGYEGGRAVIASLMVCLCVRSDIYIYGGGAVGHCNVISLE